ncbi:MAG: hypothetical protein ABIZ49_09930, partial [Opitutaceae bacterium]
MDDQLPLRRFMAARKKSTPKPASPHVVGPRPAKWTHRDSVFWRRIEESDDATLKVGIGGMVDDAKALAQLVIKELPLFTLHDETHLDNVLYWMEQLVSDEGLEELGPVGCAVCLLLAYTHDLGLVPEPGWSERLKDENNPDAIRFRQWATQRHADLLDLLERCRATNDPAQRKRAEWIEGFLRVDFLRDTHADEGHDTRVAAHLRRLAQIGKLKSTFDFLGDEDESIALLTAMAASHNRRVDWWSGRLEARAKRSGGGGAAGAEFWRVHAGAGTANLLLPSLLLRLADVCDFDRSRTPAILFHQLGLEGFKPLGLS